MTLARILVGTDFSEPAVTAVTQALRLARHTGARLVLAHAHPMTEAQLDAAEASLDRAEDFRHVLRRAIEAAHERLGEVRERISGQGVEIEQVLADAPPADGLCSAAEEIDADLVVVGSRGRTGLRRLLLGSVAEKVVRRCKRDVLVARGDAGTGGFRRILAPVDFSPPTGSILERAAELAAPHGQLDALHCYHLPYNVYGLAGEGGAMLGPLAADLRRDAERRGEALIAEHRAPGVTTSFRALQATAPEGILRELDEGAYDLVVMGSHGRTGLSRYLLGSVAEATVRHAPCSVLVVHPR